MNTEPTTAGTLLSPQPCSPCECSQWADVRGELIQPINKYNTMKTTIKDKTKWIQYCGIAGMTAKEWLHQVRGYERETMTKHSEVMSNLRIGVWSHTYHYAGDYGLENTQHAYDALLEEVQRLADALDERLHQITAIENNLRDIASDKETEDRLTGMKP